MEAHLTALDPDERFRFDCSPAVPCFNACCHDLNHYLTPYDIWRLTRRLGMASGAFLAAYTETAVGPASGLPVVSLRMPEALGKACPFVTDAGCSVYADRPTACRIYPLARALRRCRQSGMVTEHFALIREAHCRGFEQDRLQTVRDWLQGQETAVYTGFNDRLMALIQLKNRLLPGPLDLLGQQAFRLGLYDMDAFRDHLARNGAPEGMPLGKGGLEALLADELELLRFGHDWVRFVLFNGREAAGSGEPDSGRDRRG